MAKVRLGMTMSIDGFVADKSGSSELLYRDLIALRDTEYMQEEIDDAGAVLMGRHAYDMAQGDLTGYEFQVPIFVLTHRPPDVAPKGQNGKLSVTFVSDGLESAISQAKLAAGEKYVISMGGAATAQQLLNSQLVDELQIDIMPILLKTGIRFFEDLVGDTVNLEKVKMCEVGVRTSIRYKILK